MKENSDAKHKWPTLEDRLNNPLTTRREALEQLKQVMQLSESAEKELKKRQPIFVVNRQKVLEIIERWSHFQRIPYQLFWGKVQTKEELFDAVNKLKTDDQGRIDMSKLAQCIQSFYSPKLGANCNCALRNVWSKIKDNREAI